jgi:NTP pyrophosphatase (non-canonical NTP hydrolase)
MNKSLKDLQLLMIEQLKRRGYYPKDEKEVLLRLGEEMGEVFEAVRENQSKENLSHEVVDVLWNLLRFCELKNIDLEKAFLEKLAKNETRPLNGPITDISQNS